MRRKPRVTFGLWVIVWLLATILAAQTAAATGRDPADSGPFEVTREEYSFGDTAFTPSDFVPLVPPARVEVLASVHYPTPLDRGPLPLIIFLHGRHVTCFLGEAPALQWPCTPPRQPIPSYRGYDYAAEILASQGYIVVSISANGINARDSSVVSDRGALARAELLQHHLDIWYTFNTTGGKPFGEKFVGKVNLHNVGTMGHSRGGEGVVRQVLLNRSLGSPYGIKAVLPLAPVNVTRAVINNVPLAVQVPYCDGDVTDLQGVHFFDDARYNVPGDTAPKHLILVLGANHNFYNTIWTPEIFRPGAEDDWLWLDSRDVIDGELDPHCGLVEGNQRLTAEQQRGTGLAYFTAFFRTYLGRESGFFPLLTGDAPPPPSAMTTNLHVSYHPADDPLVRRDVNRLLEATNLTTNTLGGAVTQVGLTPYELCGGEVPQPQHCLPATDPPQPTSRQPHTTPSDASLRRGLSQLQLGWDAPTASYQNELPVEARDVSGYFALQFRASVDFLDTRNEEGVPQDFSVTLTDGAGEAATAVVSHQSRALFFPPGRILPLEPGRPLLPVPKILHNTVRIPLEVFCGIDLRNVESIRFDFDQRSSGALYISDLLFADVRQPPPPDGSGANPES